jgi:hypothetical protein
MSLILFRTFYAAVQAYYWEYHSTRQKSIARGNFFFFAFHQISKLIYHHRSDLITSLSFSVKILHRLDISLILSLISFIVILFHSFNSICFSSETVFHRRRFTRILSIFHTAFEEFKSGDCQEWINVSLQLLFLKRTIRLSFDRVSWLLSLSSCKMFILSWKIRCSLIICAYTDRRRSV